MVLNTYDVSVAKVLSLKLYLEETRALLANRMQKNQLKHTINSEVKAIHFLHPFW